MYGYIYKTTNLKNGKIYIGQHKHPHFDPHYFGSGVWFKKVFLANGKENFHCEIIEKCDSLEEMNNREEYWIERCQSRNPHIGYNLAKGGEQIYCGCTEKERKLISRRLLDATAYNIYDEINVLREYGLRIYEPGEIWEPTSPNSKGEKMRATDISVVVSFYTRNQESITRRYAQEFCCAFWRYNLMVDVEKIPKVFKKLKEDYFQQVLLPESTGVGNGTTGVFLETARGVKSARMYIEFEPEEN